MIVAPTPTTALPQLADLLDAAVAGQFSTLVAAIEAAGLVETLKGAGPFTVFAPTDEAFANLPKGTLDDWLKGENRPKLRAILEHHVVNGNLMAADVAKMQSATTVGGGALAIRVAAGALTVDGVAVATTDIAASNGVIHVLDAVLRLE